MMGLPLPAEQSPLDDRQEAPPDSAHPALAQN